MLGTRPGNNNTVKSFVPIIQKSVFTLIIYIQIVKSAVDGLPLATAADSIQVSSCFASKSWLRKEEREQGEQVTDFGVCVPASQRQKVIQSIVVV